ncbi:sensor histidine kinase [Nocardioides mangrovi]|uniref:Sensor-like histidine kinase SenX3 n=1 Tax=Nocardioides mangrovi TaxID=2874580 RepID=A0ABS7UFE2_9ACTN|nr:HAMP domain-containing sensor histidine kinase [Nocardioides mangrovi]MBZ5739719.1 HAMP domain-containing histidine kinase [Nocardioides mangrovi]
MLQWARAPRGCREGVTTAVLAALIALPMVRIALDPDAGAQRAATVGTLLAHAALLAAGTALFLERRLGGPRGDSWLVVVLTAIGTQGVYWSALAATDVVSTPEHPTLLAAGLVAGTLLVLLAVRASGRLPDSRAPLVTGCALGLGVIGIRSIAASLASEQPAGSPSTAVVGVLLGIAFALTVAVAIALLRIATVPPWVRLRLAVAVTLLALGRITLLPDQGSWPAVVAAIATTAAAVVLLATTADQVRTTLLTEREVRALLERRIEDVEAEIRNDRSRVHEIRATLGGIASASDLLHRRAATIGPARRAELESMMDSELARLERLTTDDAALRPGTVDLDSTILPLVLRHRLRGTDVRWEPSGATAWGRADDVAEILSVLLENARQHAPYAEVRIEVHPSEETVEIRVSDTGPGVDPLLGNAIFAWGGHRAGSPGEGIGLSTASELSAALGGYLRLVDSPGGGATFALGLRPTSVHHDNSASA